MGRNNKKKKTAAKEAKVAEQSVYEATTQSDGRDSAYVQYKRATAAFRDGLSRLLPSIMVPLNTVADLGNAVDYLAEQEGKIVIPGALMKNLEESIRLRENVSEQYVGNADEGHKYMLDMLKYCQSSLQQCRRLYHSMRRMKARPARVSPTSVKDEGARESETVKGRFEALNVHSDDDESEDEGKNEDDVSVERPPKPDRVYSIETDLIEGTHRFQACWFLDTISHLFNEVNTSFESLKESMKAAHLENGGTFTPEINSLVLHLLLVTTAAVNRAIEDVRYLEEALEVDCPQLRTFYHVLAIILYPNKILDIEKEMDPARLAANPHICLDFVAESIEIGFRTSFDPIFFNWEKRSDAFVKATGVSHGLAKSTAKTVQAESFIEILPDSLVDEAKKGTFADLFEFNENTQSYSHTWFDCFPNISGKRSIFHTQSLLQSITHTMQNMDILAELPTDLRDFGPSWNEKDNKAEGTRDACMDALLYYDLLPDLFYCGKYKSLLFTKKEVLRVFPLLRELRDYIDQRDAPVSIAVSFAVHAMLMGIICLQGDGDVQRLALLSKFACRKFSGQIKDLIRSEPSQSRSYQFLSENLDILANPLCGSSVPIPVELRASWNPLVGGSFLLTMEFGTNLHKGSVQMNYFLQTTITLHLYNALHKRNLIAENDWLEKLSAIMCGVKTIWAGGTCPDQGSFTKNFLCSTSASPMAAKKATHYLYSEMMHTRSSVQEDTNGAPSWTRVKELCDFAYDFGSRKCPTPHAREWSGSYRMLMERDFTGIPGCERESVDSEIMSRRGVEVTVETHIRHSRALGKQMCREREILSINWYKLGGILHDFMSEMTDLMSWGPVIDDLLGKAGLSERNLRLVEVDKAFILTRVMVLALFYELDFEGNANACANSMKVSKFMTEFFGKLRDEDIRFL